ncbi:hypothetical protein MRX96_028141 [Rhipicephalus microplus]
MPSFAGRTGAAETAAASGAQSIRAPLRSARVSLARELVLFIAHAVCVRARLIKSRPLTRLAAISADANWSRARAAACSAERALLMTVPLFCYPRHRLLDAP